MTQKQIEQKAKEIAGKYILPINQDAAVECLIEMAEWVLSHQWMSVEDELPPFEEDVIVHYIWRTISSERFGHRSDNPKILTDENGFCNVMDDEIITNWMPIPPLTEKGGEK